MMFVETVDNVLKNNSLTDYILINYLERTAQMLRCVLGWGECLSGPRSTHILTLTVEHSRCSWIASTVNALRNVILVVQHTSCHQSPYITFRLHWSHTHEKKKNFVPRIFLEHSCNPNRAVTNFEWCFCYRLQHD